MGEENPTETTSPNLELKKDQLVKEHLAYVEAHPELKHILSDFLNQVLIEKPDGIQEFAAEYFAPFLPNPSEPLTGGSRPLVVAGPSGVGKGTLLKKLMAEFGDKFAYSVSHTTRDPREGEVDGEAYHFVTREDMEKQIEDGLFLESANVHGNLYGTSVASVNAVAESGRICILELDICGVQAVQESGLKPHTLYIAPPSFEGLEERLRSRGTEDEEKVKVRLETARKEIDWLSQPGNVEKTIVNDDLEGAFEAIKEQLKEWYADEMSA